MQTIKRLLFVALLISSFSALASKHYIGLDHFPELTIQSSSAKDQRLSGSTLIYGYEPSAKNGTNLLYEIGILKGIGKGDLSLDLATFKLGKAWVYSCWRLAGFGEIGYGTQKSTTTETISSLGAGMSAGYLATPNLYIGIGYIYNSHHSGFSASLKIGF